MTIDELIERLEEYRDVFGGDAEVRLMTQQHWPFEDAVYGVVSGPELNDHDEEDGEDVEADRVVYIVEGQQLGYGSNRAWDFAN